MKYNRRSFISFLGKASLGSLVIPPFLMSCGNTPKPTLKGGITEATIERLKKVLLKSINPSDIDDLVLTDGLHYQTIIKWGDHINAEDAFGFNNDFTCFIPLDENNPKDGLLWVNHEYINPLFVSGYNHRNIDEKRTKQQVDKEMYNVGGSIVRIKEENGTWSIVKNDQLNRRITAKTPMQLN